MDTHIVHKVKDDHAKIRDEGKTSTYAPIIGCQVGGGAPHRLVRTPARIYPLTKKVEMTC